MASANVEPVVVEDQAEFSIDGKGFAEKGSAAGVHSPRGGVEELSGISVEIDIGGGVPADNAAEGYIRNGIELIVDLAEPTESGGHDQVTGESLAVGQDKTGAQVG